MASTPRKKRNNWCTNCGRPTSNHPGPAGKKCSNFPVEEHEESPRSLSTDKPDNKDDVLHELADQMGRITIHLQSLQDDMGDMKRDLKEVRQESKASLPGSKASDYMAAGPAPAGTLDVHQCLPSGAKVASKVIQQAKNGEYVNLADFAPCLEPSLVTETSIVDGVLVFKPKKNIKSMDSFLLWSMAWRTYEELLVGHNPDLYTGFCAYRVFIQTCATKHLWPSVYSYDVRNRAKHSMEKSFQFNVIDNDIYVTTMDSSTIRPNVRQCTRCKSILHPVRDCPFSEDGALAPAPRASQTPQSGQSQPRRSSNSGAAASQQVCFNFNAGRCNTNRCVRLHICERCGGPDPLLYCPRCNPTQQPQLRPRAQQQPAVQQNLSIPPPSSNATPSGRLG